MKTLVKSAKRRQQLRRKKVELRRKKVELRRKKVDNSFKPINFNKYIVCPNER